MSQNKYLLLFICLLGAVINLQAAIDADIEVATYYEDSKPYIDISLHFVGSTLTEKEVEGGKVETRVNVLITILQNGDIVDFQKYGLVSPIANKVADFIDLRRFALPIGSYTIKVDLVDQLKNTNQFHAQTEIEIKPLPLDNFLLSNMTLFSTVEKSSDESHPFFKYGNIVEPAAFSFFHQSMSKMYVFAEMYNAGLHFNSDFAFRTTISNVDEKSDIMVKYKRVKPDSKIVLLEGLDISDIPSGNYSVTLDIVNSSSEVQHTQQIFFQRSNPPKDKEILLNSDINLEGSFISKLSDDELEYNLKALVPRLNQMEMTTINILMEDENVKGQRFYLYNYWTRYDPVTTEQTFNTYWKIAEAVDRMFYNTVGRGFETDRGYIFLKYGKPQNVISVENEPSAPPYEIWFYDQLEMTGEVNVRFLFYNPSLGGGDYVLLHSTTRNERRNPRWEVELYADAPNEIEGNRVDATTVKDNFNRRAREYFEDNN